MTLRHALLYISQQPRLRQWVADSMFARRLTKRFVAGDILDDALAVCARLNTEGMLTTLDYLGENVRSPDEAAASCDAYLKALDHILARRLRSTISVKLTQLGLDLSEDTCRENIAKLAAAASRIGNWVEVDMESSEYVDRTLRLVMDVNNSCGCLRAVVQAYLRRSANDIGTLCKRKIPVRLCKGAYKEPAEVAFPKKQQVDENYLRLMQRLLCDGTYPAVATHDSRIIREVIRMARNNSLTPDRFEFQMLYGIRESLQRQLVKKGFRVRIYVPYGVAWFPYFTRRLAERPANLWFLVKSLVQR